MRVHVQREARARVSECLASTFTFTPAFRSAEAKPCRRSCSRTFRQADTLGDRRECVRERVGSIGPPSPRSTRRSVSCHAAPQSSRRSDLLLPMTLQRRHRGRRQADRSARRARLATLDPQRSCPGVDVGPSAPPRPPSAASLSSPQEDREPEGRVGRSPDDGSASPSHRGCGGRPARGGAGRRRGPATGTLVRSSRHGRRFRRRTFRVGQRRTRVPIPI